MDRRLAVKNISLLLGGALIGMEAMLSGCSPADKKGEAKPGENSRQSVSQEELALLNEIADTILPTTPSSPGAKAAAVGQFMVVMVNDCYDEKDRRTFYEGIQKFEKYARQQGGKKFMEMNPAERTALLTKLDKEATQYQDNKKKDDENHYFRMMKELTLLGYFTSEIGCTKARRYVAVPGSYQGCVPYVKGDKAWA